MTADEIKREFFNEVEMAKTLGITKGTLRNRISAGHDHPPYTGRGRNRRFYVDSFRKWERSQEVKGR